jgi:hypothetical protein
MLLLAFAPLATSAAEEAKTMSDPRIAEAVALMLGFAQRTGLDADRPPQRYLWTDAFAVCNFLGLARATGEQRYTALALRLVEQVHHTLGRHREDDPRQGWVSGLSERDGESHPTRGGLRIGKRLPERGPDAPLDERLEWDRDGQYFHYLTKWMHALDQVSRSTGEARFNLWARELAATAAAAFTYLPAVGRRPRMHWKMSIDLTRALVPSMGQHDPLDGYITTLALRTTAAALPAAGGPDLADVIRRFATMTEALEWASADPLGIGGLLADAYRVAQLAARGAAFDAHFVERLLAAARAGLESYAASAELRAPAEYRLAFRELGLAIGLHALRRLAEATALGGTATSPAVRAQLEALRRYLPLAEAIEVFWRDPAHRRASTWLEHRDINEVMLATSLAPAGFLVLGSAD